MTSFGAHLAFSRAHGHGWHSRAPAEVPTTLQKCLIDDLGAADDHPRQLSRSHLQAHDVSVLIGELLHSDMRLRADANLPEADIKEIPEARNRHWPRWTSQQ